MSTTEDGVVVTEGQDATIADEHAKKKSTRRSSFPTSALPTPIST